MIGLAGTMQAAVRLSSGTPERESRELGLRAGYSLEPQPVLGLVTSVDLWSALVRAVLRRAC